jgi:hypothetical protein
MTFPLIAFFLWLVSTDTLTSGDPAAQFITLANIQDGGTQSLLTNVGSMLPTDGSIQKAHDAFAYWRWYFAQPGIALYPKSCTVYPAQIAAIANLSTQFLLKTKAAKVTGLPDDATPAAGIALFLLVASTPNYLDANQVCSAYACGVACTTDLNYGAFQTAIQNGTLIAKIDTARAFYQQYLQILGHLNVNMNNYPGGWLCAIKTLSQLTAADSTRHSGKQH